MHIITRNVPQVKGRMKILIAEDESSISMQYYLVLKERGHDVLITENGEICLSEYVSSFESSMDSATQPNQPCPSFRLGNPRLQDAKNGRA